MVNGGPKISVRDLGFFAGALVAGIMGTVSYQGLFPPRPDPFTGSDALRMEALIRKDINRVETLLQGHLNYSQRKVEFYDSQIALLNERCKKQGDR